MAYIRTYKLKIVAFTVLSDKRARTKCNHFESFGQKSAHKLANTILILPSTMATSTPSTPNIQRSLASYTLVYSFWDHMCPGFGGPTQYSRRGGGVSSGCKTSSMVHLLFRHSTSRATICIVSRCAITDEISTLTVNTNGVVDDGGGGGTTTSKRCPRHKCLLFFIR
jgi:hypothetical protein